MPKNNSKTRKAWRRDRAEILRKPISFEELLLLAIFGDQQRVSDDDKPGTEFGRK